MKLAALFAVLASPLATAQVQVRLIPLGSPPANGSRPTSVPIAVSRDGTTVVGSVSDTSDVARAFVERSGQPLMLLPGAGGSGFGLATAVSDDGSVVSGDVFVGSSGVGALWSAGAAPVQLPSSLPFADSTVTWIAGDSSLVIGESFQSFTPFQQVSTAWMPTGALVALPPNVWLVGGTPTAQLLFGRGQGGPVIGDLTTGFAPAQIALPAGLNAPELLTVDATGELFGGSARTTLGVERAIAWSRSTGLATMLPAEARTGVLPLTVNAQAEDAPLLLCFYEAPFTRTALWSPGLGTFDLVDYLEDFGADFSGIVAVLWANDVSGDGEVFVGSGFTATNAEQGWIATLPDGWWTEAGTPYCGPAVANSSGEEARTRAFGSSVVTEAALRLETHGLPAGTFGVYAVGSTAANVPAAGGVGTLCIGGVLGRFNGPGQVLDTTAQRRVALAVDLGALPGPSGLFAAQPGETWRFQFWFRDTVQGTMTSNFSDAVAVQAL